MQGTSWVADTVFLTHGRLSQIGFLVSKSAATLNWCSNLGGLAFDVFGSSEALARQASSTLLAVFTFSVSLAVVIGGIIYDLAGWQGMSVLHVCCVSAMLLIFSTEPVCLQSFRDFLGQKSSTDVEAKDKVFHKVSIEDCTSVVPVPVDDLQVEEMEPEVPGLSPVPETQDAEAAQKELEEAKEQSKLAKLRTCRSLDLIGHDLDHITLYYDRWCSCKVTTSSMLETRPLNIFQSISKAFLCIVGKPREV